MKKINYSEFDLSGFTVKELQRICRYYDIQYQEDWIKEKLIEEILNYSPKELIEKTISYDINSDIHEMVYPTSIIEKQPLIKSVRMQRIEESIEKGK